MTVFAFNQTKYLAEDLTYHRSEGHARIGGKICGENVFRENASVERASGRRKQDMFVERKSSVGRHF